MEHLEINHNLLSAYIDNDVSEEERLLIELAVENEPRLAWEVATLQQTVSMLNSLSESDFPLLAKPLRKIPFESSSVKSSLVKLAPTKRVHHSQIQHKKSEKLNMMRSEIRQSSSFSKKPYDVRNVSQLLYRKFNLAQQIFWQLGSPLWRGIAIMGLLLLLLLLGSDIIFLLLPSVKLSLIKAQYTAQVGISTIQSTNTFMGLGIHRTYLLIIYLIISVLTFMSTMLWWRSNSYH